jgi:hypothetical protein
MVKHWWEIFDNAAIYLRGFIGSGKFIPFARMYEKHKAGKDDPGIKAAFKKMQEATQNSGYNYAGMVYQLKSRMRPGMPGGPDLNDILGRLDSALKGAAQQIISRWNRAIRPEDPGFAGHGVHGRTSHDIEMLHQIIDDEQVQQDVGKVADANAAKAGITCDADRRECQMTQNIISTGLAFQLFRHIYIWIKQQSGESWNLRDANQFASRALDKHLEKRGIKRFGGEIAPGGDPSKKGTAAYTAAQLQKERETELRGQLAPAARQQAPGTVLPGDVPEEDFEAQREKAMQLLKVLQHPKTIIRLRKGSNKYDPKLREFFEKMVQDKAVAWKFVEKILTKIDGPKKS